MFVFRKGYLLNNRPVTPLVWRLYERQSLREGLLLCRGMCKDLQLCCTRLQCWNENCVGDGRPRPSRHGAAHVARTLLSATAGLPPNAFGWSSASALQLKNREKPAPATEAKFCQGQSLGGSRCVACRFRRA